MMPGRARSLSVIDRPQVGQATQAIDQRRTLEISSRQLDAVPAEDLFERRAVRRPARSLNRMLWCDVRRMPGLQRVADFAERRLQLNSLVVVDAAVLDVQAVEPAAVPLLVPAHVVVEAVHVGRVRSRRAAGRSTPRPWL